MTEADIEQKENSIAAEKKTEFSFAFKIQEETSNALEAWKAMMPGQIYQNYRALVQAYEGAKTKKEKEAVKKFDQGVKLCQLSIGWLMQ
jgi:hypothetical protein